MLTSDLLRYRTRKGVVKPQYVKASDEVVSAADELVSAYREGVGKPAGDVRGRVDDIVGHGTDFLLWRGLAKLLEDRSEFETVAPVDPVELRRRIFEVTFAGPIPFEERRAEILTTVGDEFGVSAQEVEEALYADLDARQILTEFNALEAEGLIHRYNLALAQAVLYRATRMRVVLKAPNPDKLRYLMGALKFHGLMHRAVHEADELHVEIDGPASLFKLSRKYGLNMALFLPALVLLEDWEIVADLDWKGKDREFKLSSKDGLVSHYRARGQWRTDEEKWFEQKWADYSSDWKLERRGTLVELRDGEVIVADYALTSPDGDEVAIEIVSFWRAAYLRRRIEMLDSVDRPFVMVVSERLKADRAKLEVDLPLEVVFYKGVIIPGKVLASAEAALEG